MSNSLSISDRAIRAPGKNAGHWALAPWRYLTRREHYLGPPSIRLRVKFFLTGALLPLACIALMIAEGDPSSGRLWQSGKLDVYIALLFKWRAQIVFLPLVIFHIVSLCSWLVRPSTIKYLIVRLGVYSGIPLAAQYLFLFGYMTAGLMLVCSLIVGPLLALGVLVVDASYRHRRRIWIIGIWSVIVVSAVGALIAFPYAARDLLLFVLIVCVVAAPVLSWMTYIRASIMVAVEHQRHFGRERRSLLGWLLAVQALAATWFAGWKIAIDVMLFEYSKLPTTPPNCYLSAAAQHRHAWLFREATNDVSLQTKRLKFLEIALRCAAPRLHAALRRVYDHLGPPLANVCRKSRWFADLTYGLLLPVEAIAVLLRRPLRIPSDRIAKMYAENDATA